MAVGIGALIALASLWVMSRPFKLVVLFVLGGSLAWGFSVSETFSNQMMTDENMKLGFTLISVNTGLLALAVICGFIRRMASTEQSYLSQRNSFYKFLVKLGATYAAYYVAVAVLLTMFGVDEGLIWGLLRFYGIYGFAIVVALWWTLRQTWRRRARVQPSHADRSLTRQKSSARSSDRRRIKG